MLASTSCPNAELLAQFSEGRLAAAMMDQLARHVGSCSSCVYSLHHLSSSDALIASLRDLDGSGSLPQYGSVNVLVERLKRAANATQETHPPEQGTNSKGGQLDAPTEEILRLLAPARSAGELGRLGAHRVLAVLGVGGMGVVFRAEDETLRRPVALKVMLPMLAAIPEARHRFLREARAMAAVTHDHIVPVFGVGEESGTPYLAMPLLEGESLENRLRRDPLMAVGEIVRLGRQVALGLAAAHEKGLIHRDVKPANIWLEVLPGDALPRVKLLDFGLVLSAQGDADGLRTEAGMMLGTPLYMAPEQTGGQVDHRADLFSLGCVLYQLATGKLPFTGNGVAMILRNVALVHPPAPHTLNPQVPIRLSRLIQALMAKEPQERPSSARLVARSLEHSLVSVEEGGTQQSSCVPVGKKTTNKSPLGARHRRGWRWGMVATGLTMTVLAVVAWCMVGPRSRTGDDGQRAKKDDPVELPALVKAPDSGKPLSRYALAGAPAKIEGLTGSWTVEPIGHRGRISALAYSADSKTLVTAGLDGTVRFWDSQRGKLLRVLVDSLPLGFPTHQNSVGQLALSRDGRWLAAYRQDDKVSVWDVKKGQRVREFAVQGCGSLAWSPDGKMLFAGLASLGKTRMWDLATGDLETTFTQGSTFALSPDGKSLMFVSMGQKPVVVQVNDGTSKTLPFQLGSTAVFGLYPNAAWSPDSSRIAVGTPDTSSAAIIEVSSGKVTSVEMKGVLGGGFSWVADGATLLFADNIALQAVNPVTGKIKRSYKGIGFSKVSPDGKQIAFKIHPRGLGRYDLAQEKPLPSEQFGTLIEGTLLRRWMPDGSLSTWVGHQQFGGYPSWNTATAKMHDIQKTDDARTDPRLSGDGKRILEWVEGKPGNLQVREVESKKVVGTRRFSLFDHGALSSDGKSVMVFRGGTAQVAYTMERWDVESDKVVPMAVNLGENWERNMLASCRYSPRDDTIASIFTDGRIVLWSGQTGKVERTIQGGSNPV